MSETEKSRANKPKRAGTKGGGTAKTPPPRKRTATATPPADGALADDPPATTTATTDLPPPEAAAIAIGRRVGVLEAGKANQGRAVSVVEALGYELVEAADADAMRKLRGDAAPDVILVGVPGGEALIASVCKLPERRPVVIATMAGPAGTAPARCAEAGADLFALRPLSSDAMAGTLHAALALAGERERVRSLRVNDELLRARLQRYGQADTATGFQHFDFFRRILVMELKRAKRYGYSLAVCLVAVDPRKPDEPEPSPEAARKLRTRVASAISSSIRDIDLPIDYADDRMLVFLPYTDIEGATSVGKRIASAVVSYGTIEDAGRAFTITVSVGIAALRPGRPVSFARLMKEAGAAVRAAQLKGGGRIVIRK